MGERNLGKAAAVVLAVGAFMFMGSSPASANDRLSRSDAYLETKAKVERQAAKGERVDGWSVGHCTRKGAVTFRCRGLLIGDSAVGSFRCRLTYLVKSVGGEVRARLVRKRCVPNPIPWLSRDLARNAAQSEGEMRAGGFYEVSVVDLERESRNRFSAVARWVSRGGRDVFDCSVGIQVTLTGDRPTTTADEQIRCEGRGYDPGFQIGPGPKYCPGFSDRSWDARPAIQGKTLAEATAIAKAHDCEVRVIRRDGENLIVTDDLRYNRINVEVEGAEQVITDVVSVA